MRAPSVTPLNQPADFKVEEMFFSTTDERGIIQSGNAVFARVSGYTLPELIGQPHNLIRHPDMPRVVFRLLWTYVKQGRPIVALVKNMARDGRYYWVVALVTPIPGGFLSVRFKPSIGTIALISEVYARVRAEEIAQTEAGADGRAAMDAAETLLLAELNRLGFADYDHFMWHCLHQEIKHRDGLTGATRVRSHAVDDASAAGASSVTNVVLRSIHAAAAQAYDKIDSLYRGLDQLTTLHAQLVGQSSHVVDLAHNIRFVALSTTIKSAHLGEEGRSLGVIAQYLSEASGNTSREVRGLTDHLQSVSNELQSTIFSLASVRLQLEMTLFFITELRREETTGRTDKEVAGASRASMIGSLQQAFHATTQRTVKSLDTFGEHLTGLTKSADALRRTIISLHLAQIGGRAEASRIRHDDSVLAMLTEIQGYIDKTVEDLDGIGSVTARFGTLVRSVPSMARSVDRAVRSMETDVRQLASRAATNNATAVTVSPDHAQPVIGNETAAAEPELLQTVA